MAYLPLPIRGFKSAVYVVRQRHHNHAIIGCMLEQRFHRLGIYEEWRAKLEEILRWKLTSQLHPNVPSAYEMELYDLSPQRMAGSPARAAKVSWNASNIRKAFAVKRFWLEHNQSTPQHIGSVVVIWLWSTHRCVVFCGGIGFSVVQRDNKQTALDGLQDAGVDGVNADQMLSGLQWTERGWSLRYGETFATQLSLTNTSNMVRWTASPSPKWFSLPRWGQRPHLLLALLHNTWSHIAAA